jgi:hypothetical protein
LGDRKKLYQARQATGGDGNLRGAAECRLNIFTGKENCEHFLTLSPIFHQSLSGHAHWDDLAPKFHKQRAF